MEFCGIYEIRNNINNKKYIGSSKYINKRFNQHLVNLRKKIHGNQYLQNAFDKYGEENFSFNILEECSINELLIIEQQYLDKDKDLYNIAPASGGDLLSNHPNREEILKQRSISLKLKYKKMSSLQRKQRFSMPLEKNPNWKGGKSYSFCDCGNRKKNTANTCRSCYSKLQSKRQLGSNNTFLR